MRWVVVVALAACGHAATTETGRGTGTGTAKQSSASTRTTVDAGVSQDEILAAIQKAMNDLAPAANQCWGVAAAERYQIAGDLRARITVGDAQVGVDLVANTTGSDALATCMTKLLMGYAWAPPLHQQTFELPFHFTAPAGQSVIDRRFVPWHGQDRTSIAVLLDEANTGNAAAAMLEVALQPGASTGYRWTEGSELWYFLSPATVDGKPLAAGDMIYAPAGSAREIAAKDAVVHAVAIYVPGGREGIARAGALPDREVTSWRSRPAEPVVLGAARAKTHGTTAIFLDAAIARGTPLSAAILTLPAGAELAGPPRTETELLYVLGGSGTITIGGTALPVTATSAIQIPPGVEHELRATAELRALQVFTPAGPEQRFEKP